MMNYEGCERKGPNPSEERGLPANIFVFLTNEERHCSRKTGNLIMYVPSALRDC
jgi:hypothetical protein